MRRITETRPSLEEGQASTVRRHRGLLRRCPSSDCWRKIFVVLIFIVVGYGTVIFRWQQDLFNMGIDAVSGWTTWKQDKNALTVGVGVGVRFEPSDLMRRFQERGDMDRLRKERRYGGRLPRIAIIIDRTEIDSRSLMLLTLVKSLQELGYTFAVFSLRHGRASFLWEDVGCYVSIIDFKSPNSIDWSNYEGVILSSLEAKRAISSFMVEPFNSVPLIWLVHEDILAKRLPTYSSLDRQDLIVDWRRAFSRADVVVFPDFSIAMLYSLLDTGNFYVIPGTPADVWGARIYIETHSQHELRKENGFNEGDLILLLIGNYVFYDEVPCGLTMDIGTLAPQIFGTSGIKELKGTLKFVLWCGNSTNISFSYRQKLASRLGFPEASVRQFGMDKDVNSLLLMADIVLYGSSQDEQTFPRLLLRAMFFEKLIIAPNISVVNKYVRHAVHGMLFDPNEPTSLFKSFSLLVSEKKLSQIAHMVAHSGKLLSENMLAWDLFVGYAKLLENVLQFPSDVRLPGSVSKLKIRTWPWNLFEMFYDKKNGGIEDWDGTNFVMLEEQALAWPQVDNISSNENKSIIPDYPAQHEWEELSEIEMSEDLERRELQELEERMEKASGSWEDLYRNVKKSEKLNFEANEHDEGELERVGQVLCIYEVYIGEGTWPFLHHGSLYRGLSLSRGARRSSLDDVSATARLPILNDSHYRNIICELGAMFSIANRVDEIHNLPWIGFQSWRAAGKRVSLSDRAEKALEDAIHKESKGDVVYFWAVMDIGHPEEEKHSKPDFWSLCDIANRGHCRVVFEHAFRTMYGLHRNIAALPPMPNDYGQWSALHSWVMPTPSFIEFVMFSRMYVDSLDSLFRNSTDTISCVLGSSKLEKSHCYCRLLELLVNVWAYHSARKMVYINPISGELKEQHPIEQRKGLMWVKFFELTLLKSMDEDLAEEADDRIHQRDRWLWPLTGEVHWQGVFDQEREERYRRKMDKKRRTKEKLLQRQKHGYKQKPLGG